MNKERIYQAAETAQLILEDKDTIIGREKEIIRSLEGAFEVQIELAKALDISPQYLGDILRRRRGMSDEFLKAVIKVANKLQKQK